MKQRFIKFAAFTLAEVLLTLGIIGVVAEMTIPTLVSSYENKIYLTSLKEFYTTFNQGMTQIRANYGCEDMKCAGVFATNTDAATWQTNFDKEMKSVFKITESSVTGIKVSPIKIKILPGIYAGWYITWGDDPNFVYTYKTVQGALVAIHNANGSDCWTPSTTNQSKFKQICSGVVFDTNGDKPPNAWGRDTWSAYVTVEGQLIPDYGTDYSQIDIGNGWATSNEYWRSASADDMCSKDFLGGRSGEACFAKIMEEGWQMNY